MIQQNMNVKDVNQYSGLALAYIGDAVYELMVREKIIAEGNIPVNKLHNRTVSLVCSCAQSKAVEVILDMLTEQELGVYKRGRNANGNNVPKNANAQEYRRATGLEALFGYLYMINNQDRISELFEIVYKSAVESENS